ncbi:hypothetical protein Scep_004908 [Stephania cephalantha]|uniref:Uncharacterized protein n=1 Tax=Stephania cephalantha TaxID=152367 RepID=A0AAP0PXQ3_9MAGN
MEHLTTHLHRPRTTRSPKNKKGDRGVVPFQLFFHAFPERSYFTKTCHGKEEGGTSTLGQHSTIGSCLLCSRRMNRFQKESIDSYPIG